MVFHPIVSLEATQHEIGRAIEINHTGLSIICKETFQVDEILDLFIADDYLEELKEKKLEITAKVLRCKIAKNGNYEIGFQILKIKNPDGDLLINKMTRLLGGL